jgi:phospholipid-binding lipoprotein MlaA
LRAALVALALLAGQPAIADTPEAVATPDPGRATLETFNRHIFRFNRWVAASFGTVSEWDGAVPPALAGAMANVFSTYVNEPVTMVAGATAADVETVVYAGKRFLLNATLGIAGLFDAAAARGLPARHLDWGLAACAQGVSNGPYVVIPLIGPRTTRDAILDVLPAQAIVFYGTYIVLGPFIGLGGVALLQFPELIVEALAFRQMDLEAAGIDAEDYDSVRDRYLAYRTRRCEEYKTELAGRRDVRPGPRVAAPDQRIAANVPSD